MRERYTRHHRAGVARVHRRSMAREREITREGVVESVVSVCVCVCVCVRLRHRFTHTHTRILYTLIMTGIPPFSDI